MGFKRPFESEIEELPFKHSKVSENENILAFGNLDDSSEKPVTPVANEGAIYKFNQHGRHTNGAESEVSVFTDKDVETGSSSDEDDCYDTIYPECFDFGFPRRAPVPSEDIYVSLLNGPPRKQVPVGPDHQAVLPTCEGSKFVSDLSSSTLEVDHDDNQKELMGTCIIPMPDVDSSSAFDGVEVGIKACGCLDKGSVRCLRQHVLEACEKLKKEFGEEVFEKLGFYDMGEEVAAKWSDQEERVFHQVVFSNPQSLGRNFWKHLSVVFPSRSMKEIVSYYFNVFMLRRRALQNRLEYLDIDSDDDEWHGSNGNLQYHVAEEDEDLGIEYPADLDDELKCEEGARIDDDGDVSNDDHANNDWDDDVSNGVVDAVEKDSGTDNSSDVSSGVSLEKGRIDSIVQHVDKTSGGFSDSFGTQDDSGTSFEFNMEDSCGQHDSRVSIQMTGDESNHSRCFSSNINDFADGDNHRYTFDSCDAKVWDAPYQSHQSKDDDLLPTYNIIEEIFGQGSWDGKPKDE